MFPSVLVSPIFLSHGWDHPKAGPFRLLSLNYRRLHCARRRVFLLFFKMHLTVLRRIQFGRSYFSNMLLGIAVMNFFCNALKTCYLYPCSALCASTSRTLEEKFFVQGERGESLKFFAMRITGLVCLATVGGWVIHFDRGGRECQSGERRCEFGASG